MNVKDTKLYSQVKSCPVTGLAQREKDCLTLLLEESDIAIIAKRLSLLPQTIRFYINNLCLKMQSASLSELVEKARQLN